MANEEEFLTCAENRFWLFFEDPFFVRNGPLVWNLFLDGGNEEFVVIGNANDFVFMEGQASDAIWMSFYFDLAAPVVVEDS